MSLGLRGHVRLLAVSVGLSAAALVLAGALWASFSAPSAAGGGGRAVATALPTASMPTAVAGPGGFVHVQWLESTVEGHAVGGYVVKRYDADSGALQVTGVGCQGTITALECTETTPPGSWRYTVTPVLGSWTGGESGESGSVVVGSASLMLPSTVVGGVDHPLPATLTGSIDWFAAGEGVLFRLDSPSGAVLAGTVAGAATPPAAPVASDGTAAVTVTIPNDPSLLDGGHTVYSVGDHSSFAGAGVVVDRLPPSVTLADPGSPLRGTITLSVSATDATSGVASVTLQRSPAGAGSWTAIANVTGAPFTASFDTTAVADGLYDLRAVATDAGGNSASSTVTARLVDNTNPAQTLSLSGPDGASLSGSTLYFKSDAVGSFKLGDSVTDGGSGPVSATFPAIGTAAWTHTAETVTGASPYTSSLYSWSAGAATPADQSITATDLAGNNGSSTLHFVPDTTAPTGGSVDATALVGTGSRYSTSTTLSIALDKGSDSGAGAAATGAVLKREQGTLASSDGQANGSCDYSGQSYTTLATDPGSPYTDNAAGGILTGKCYRYQYVVRDKVGNQATYTSDDVRVETASPASLAPVLTLSGAGGNTVISGSTVFTNPQAGKSGGFTVQATASDAAVGVQKLSFPTLTGYSAGGGDVASPGPYQTTYSWSGAGATANGSQTVTATGNSSLTRTGTFSVTPDTTAPTTTASGADSNWHNTAVTVGLSASDGAGAGVASVTYQVDSGSPVTVGASSTSAIVPAPANGSNDGVHTVTYYATDLLGNVESTHSVQAKIDTQAPSASSSFPAASGNYGNAGWNAGCTSAICGTASDPGSGVSAVKVTIRQVSSGLYWNSGSTFNVASEASALKTASGTTGWSLAFPQTNFPADGTYVVRVYTTDALGNTTAVGSPSQQLSFVFDRTAPAATVTFPASNGKYNASGWNGGCTSAVCGTATDATSGVASTQVSIQQASTGKYWDPNTSSFSSAGEVKVTASGTASWSLAFPASNFLAEGTYTARGYAVDAAGNTNATPPGTTFLVDRTGPTQAISTASTNTYLTGSGDAWTVYYNGNTSGGSFALSDTAADTGGSGLAGNDVWAAFNPGGGWTSKAQASCLASGACASGTYAWTGTNPTSGVTATVTTQDAAGNQDAATLTFVADTQAPSAPTMTALPAQIRNGQSLSVASAADNGGSGVKSVAYYYCAGSPCTPSTLIGSSTTGPGYAVTWSAEPTDGTYTVAAKATDNVGNVSGLGATQTTAVDNAAPTVTAVALANGGVAKTADAGDTATITYSEKIKASTFCSTWVDDGTTQTLTGVTLNFVNNGSTDALTIASAGCTFHLQQVVAGAFISTTMTIPGSTLAWNPTAKTLTITLGTPSGSVSTNVSPGKPSYTPDAALTDLAGNAISTATFTSGSNSNF